MSRATAGCVTAWLGVLAACATPTPDPVADGTWLGTITTEGNVTTVVNESGSLWGGTATLIEEASIGVEAGPAEYMFGLVVDVRATDDRIYVLDRRPPVLRVYDMDGQHLFDVGRQGQGPGEYRSPFRVAIGTDGRLFVQEITRLTVFTLDGDFVETWPGPFLMDPAHDWVATSDGQLFSPQRPSRGVRPPGRIRPIVHMIPLGPETPAGPVVVPPDYGTYPHLEAEDGYKASVPFWPHGVWAFTREGALVHGVPDEYRFQIERHDGSVAVVERIIEPVPVQKDEAAWSRRYATARMHAHEAGWSWNGPAIPEVKPYFSLLTPDANERIWVTRPGKGTRVPDCDEDPELTIGGEARRCWRAEDLIDVFGSDGRFLGDVEPPGFGASFRYRVDGTRVITWGLDAEDIPMVKRYRLVLPGEEER